MLLEFVPFTLGWFSVLGFGPERASRVEKRPIGADEPFVEHGCVCLRGVDVLVSQYLCGDMYRETASDRFSGEHSAEIMRRVVQRGARCVGQRRAIQRLGQAKPSEKAHAAAPGADYAAPAATHALGGR